MNHSNTQQGFAIVTLIAFVVIVGLVGLIGWRVYDTQQSLSTDSTTTQQANNDAPITSAADIDKAQTTLDTASIDAELDTSSLDEDLNELL